MLPLPLVALRELLIQSGYRVAFRTEGWMECLVWRASERWLGRGGTEDEVLDDVLGQMFPSHIARELLQHRLAEMATPSDAEVEATRADLENGTTSAAELTSPSGLDARIVQATEVPVPHAEVIPQHRIPEAHPAPDAAVFLPEPTAAPAQPTPAIEPETTVIPGLAEAAPATIEPAPAAIEPAPKSVTDGRASAAPAIAALDHILTEIDEQLPSFSRMSAERQRLLMLLWICRARSFEESLPEARDVEYKVAKVARRLTELGKMFWPGSVRALQLSAQPGDVPELRGMDAAATTWQIAAELARRLLDAHVARAAEDGLDAEGWADGSSRTPAPPEPDAVLEAAVAELQTRLAGPEAAAHGPISELPDVDLEALAIVAKKLRWLRGQVKDDVAWGTAVGRLRRACAAIGGSGARVRDVLDPRARPSASWAAQLGERPEDHRQTAGIAELVAELPAAREERQALFSWLVRALDVFNTPDLAALVLESKDDVAALADSATNHEDRRIRRRLRDLVKRLGMTSEEDAKRVSETLKAPVAAAPEPSNAHEGDAVNALALSALGEQVRARTQGRRALLVSNRDDSELQAKLGDLLGMTFSGCDGSVRRVQAQCERIANGSYDLVLSATGFQLHSVDGSLAKAASQAGIPYVRVNRGRPLACVQAIAREFGLMSGTYTIGGELKNPRQVVKTG